MPPHTEDVHRALAISVGSTLWVATATAQAVEFNVECDRWGAHPERQAELEARARLTLGAADAPQLRRVTLRCDELLAWLEWREAAQLELVVVNESEGLVEGALIAIEERLSGRQPSPEPAKPPSKPATLGQSLDTDGSAVVPTFAQKPRAPAQDQRPHAKTWHARLFGEAGGAGLATDVERWRHGEWGVGPRLDVGVSISSPWTFVASEGLRFSLAGIDGGVASLIALRFGAAYGAPYTPGHHWGAVAFGGWEWFYDSTELTSSATGTLGLRAAHQVETVALWVGVDGVLRRPRMHLGPDDDPRHELPQLSVLASFGGFLHAYAD